MIADDATRRDPLALARWFADRAVDFSVLPTALGEEVLRLPAADQPPLRHLLLGGEALRTRPRPEAPYETVNVYGPTETTVLCLTETVEPAVGDAPDGRTEAVPIGRPVDNVTVRVVDPSDNRFPSGRSVNSWSAVRRVRRLSAPARPHRRAVHDVGAGMTEG
ncbi:AMP-binding enzyme, partial [Streptomyces sp. Termitarium-T10T-6]